MPVSFGLRNEENERINNILNRLMELVYVPDGWLLPETEQLLMQLGLSHESLAGMDGDAFNSHLVKFHFDFANMEKLGDLLATMPGFRDKALSAYNYIQAESKVFSFEIFNKINALGSAQ